MSYYHRYHRYSADEDKHSNQTKDDITRRRLEQLENELKIEEPESHNYYTDKIMYKAHHKRNKK